MVSGSISTGPARRKIPPRFFAAIRQLFLYILGVCARRFGILMHAVTLMSTHEHVIVTDTKGRLPDFLRRLHRLVSLGTKVLRQ